MKYRVVGAKKDSGVDLEIVIDAQSLKEAQRTAADLGILVSDCEPASVLSIPEVLGVEIVSPERRAFTPPPYKALQILCIVLRVLGWMAIAVDLLVVILLVVGAVGASIHAAKSGTTSDMAGAALMPILAPIVAIFYSVGPLLAALLLFSLAAILDSWRDVAQNSSRIAWALSSMANVPWTDNRKPDSRKNR